MQVNDRARRRAGVQTPDERVGHMLSVTSQRGVDRRSGQSGVDQRRVDQLCVEEVRNHHVVGRAREGVPIASGRDVMTLAGRADDRVRGTEGDVENLGRDPPSVDRTPPAPSAESSAIDVDEVDPAGAMREAVERHIICGTGTDNGDDRICRNVSVEEAPQRVA